MFSKNPGVAHSFWAVLAASLATIGVLVLALAWRPENRPEGRTLWIFCAAGIRPPVEAAAKAYEKAYGVQVQIQEGNSGGLLAQIEVAKKGDLFLPADESFIQLARGKGLVAEAIPLARMRMVLAVKPGNPKKLQALQDLLREDVQFAVANPEAAVGKFTQRFLEQAGLWDRIKAKAKVFKPTVTELAMDVKESAGIDASLLWDATARQFGLETLEVPEFKGAASHVTLGVLTSSQYPTAALRFARYLAARDQGQMEFKRSHYEPEGGDAWEETPVLTLYGGGLNKPAIKETLEEFQQREGVEIKYTFQGCGTLVGMMKAGRIPDIYFACDGSFFWGEVSEHFQDARTLSETDMVIIVYKGNPKNIHALADLAQADLKVGVANELATLGKLTKRLFEKAGIAEKVRPNIRSEQATGDALVAQVIARQGAGGLDAAVVYAANAAGAREHLDLVHIQDPLALAVQPIAIGKFSEHKQLAGRFVEALTSARSRKRFESRGFRWHVEPASGSATPPEAERP